MAREVQIITWCDYCLTEDKHNPADEYVGLNSAGVRVLVDLCEEHAQEFIQPVQELLDNHGRTEKKTRSHTKAQTPRPDRKVTPALGPCSECGREFHSAQSLGMHRWRKHGIASTTRPHKNKSAA